MHQENDIMSEWPDNMTSNLSIMSDYSKRHNNRSFQLKKGYYMNPKQQMNPEQDVNPLTAYGTDLTELAREGKIDPVIGREDEIRRMVQILSRRNKNK